MNGFEKTYKKRTTYIVVEKMLFWLIFLFSWVLFALNTNNADYRNYENAYNLIGQGQNDGYFELMFLILVKLGNLFGLSYQGFLAAMATITLLLFRKAISNFTDNMLITYGLFIVYPFMFDIVQYRNFIAYAVCLYGLKYIYKEAVTKKDMLKYAAFVILGSLFHLSAIAYMAFLLIALKDKKNVLVISLLFSGLFIVLLAFPNLFKLLLDLVGLSRYARYDIGNNFSTFVQYAAVYIMFLALGMLSMKGKSGTKELKFMFVVLIFVPLILFSGSASRIFRNVFTVFYAIILNRTNILNGQKLQVKNFFIVLILSVTVLFVFYMQLGSGLYFDTVLAPILKNNILL